jgi:hypothetical protein
MIPLPEASGWLECLDFSLDIFDQDESLHLGSSSLSKYPRRRLRQPPQGVVSALSTASASGESHSASPISRATSWPSGLTISVTGKPTTAI